MRIAFIGKGKMEECLLDTTFVAGTELTVFAFGALGEVEYERELKGETHYFETAARLSRAAQSVVVCGCVTNTRGHKRKSAVVAENGKLLGVSDMLHAVGGGVSCGASLRVYDTKLGKMGVVVGEDVYFPETVKTLVLCGADFIVCPFGACTQVHKNILCALAYFYGIAVYFCGNDFCALAEPDGSLAFFSERSVDVAQHVPVKTYRIVETRQSGAADIRN